MEGITHPVLSAQWITFLEWGAVVFNLLYVILAVYRKRQCWVAGGIGVSLALVVYAQARLYSDATLQVFYLILAVYGWWSWKAALSGNSVFLRMSGKRHLRTGLVGLLGGLALGGFWRHFGADLPFADGLTTSFSMLATGLTAKRYLENWLYWIAIDLACVGIYLVKGLLPFALLFGLYAVFALWGYFRWRSDGRVRGADTDHTTWNAIRR